MSMSYWTLRRRAKAQVAQNILRMSEEVEDKESLFLGDSVSVSGSISSETTGATSQSLDYAVGAEPDNWVEASPPGVTSDGETSHGADSDDHGDFEVDDLPLPASDTDRDTETPSDSGENLPQQLAEWAVNCKIPHTSLSTLLGILRVYHADLPKDPRTLLGTEEKYAVQAIAGGSYYHFGLGDGILGKLVTHPNCPLEENITLQINIDGLPLLSSGDQFWPILGMLYNPSIKETFIIEETHKCLRLLELFC